MVRVYSTLTSWRQVKRACNRYFYNVLKVFALSAREAACGRARGMQVSLHGHMVVVTVPGLAK